MKYPAICVLCADTGVIRHGRVMAGCDCVTLKEIIVEVDRTLKQATGKDGEYLRDYRDELAGRLETMQLTGKV